jgi:hypothetical protein
MGQSHSHRRKQASQSRVEDRQGELDLKYAPKVKSYSEKIKDRKRERKTEAVEMTV